MTRRFLEILAGLLAFVLVLELLFRVLPVSSATNTGYYIDPDILNYPPHHSWRVATGWDLRNAQVLRSNNLGFPSHRDYVPNPRAVGLVGDSFVESSMLPETSRPGMQLERALGAARPVYALGAPGTALLDYAHRIRYASLNLNIQDFVVLMERGDIEQARCGSGNVHSLCLDAATLRLQHQHLSDASLAKRLLRGSALAQYVGGQLKLQPAELLRKAFTRETPHQIAPAAAAARPQPPGATPELLLLEERVAAEFLAIVKPELRGRLVIAITGERPGTAPNPARQELLRRFTVHMREAGFVVLDLDPLFAAHAARSKRSINVGPYDGHLNSLGVGIAMGAAAKALVPGS